MSRLLRKTIGSLFFAMPFIAASLAGGAYAQDSAPASSSSVPSDQDLANSQCIIGEERFLPGDYYYCLGSLTYGEHNYGEAQRFFTTAASWASKPAQFVLSVMALNGDHQPRNRALALAWLTLASERPNSRFKPSYDQVYKASTMAERRAADDLLEKMRPVYGDATAAVRAENRYHDGMAMLQRQDTPPGQSYCMEGVSDELSGPQRPCLPIMMYSENIDKAAVNVFDGWTGHVTVGPLEQVPAPGKTASNAN
jgi:hypothetical protein